MGRPKGRVAGWQALGQAPKLPPSRIHRRLIREGIHGGPDFFTREWRGCITKLHNSGKHFGRL